MKLNKENSMKTIEISVEDFKLIKSFLPSFTRPEGIKSNKYFIDWNRLMAIVDKIESFNFEFSLTSTIETYEDDRLTILFHVAEFWENGVTRIIQTSNDHKLECTYNCVRDFIKWYNSIENKDQRDEKL